MENIMAIDFSRRVQTRGGLRVSLFATQLNSAKAIGGVITALDGTQRTAEWDAEGFINGPSTPSPFDLENVPAPTEGFLNIYQITPGVYEFDFFADRNAAIRGERVGGAFARRFLNFRPGQTD
jgi:hypothetical protein